MKIFTLSALALLLSMPSTAQSSYTLRSKNISPITAHIKATKENRYKTVALQASVKNQATSIMLPSQEEEWTYEEGEWTKSGDYFYEHDSRGNITKNTYADTISTSVTESQYNNDNNIILQIESSAEEGEDLTFTSKRVITYDPIVTNVIAESQSYTWNETDWLLIADGHTYKRIISRNDAGNITGVEIYSYFMGEYNLQQRTTITYGEAGTATSWKYEELAYSSTGELVMNELRTLTDMEWKQTNGQILVLDELDAFFKDPANQLTKANVSSQGIETGHIEASYENDGSYTFKYIYTTEPYAEETYTHTITDACGSYVETTVAYEDMNEDLVLTEDELAFEEDLTVTIDQYGRVISEIATSEEEIMFAAKYDYTYSDEYGSYPTQQIFSEYDFDEEDYVPFLKIVAKDFYDVTSIEEITSDDANAPASIYNLQGIKVATDNTTLPSGLYIIKKGDKTTKAIIK